MVFNGISDYFHLLIRMIQGFQPNFSANKNVMKPNIINLGSKLNGNTNVIVNFDN